MRIEWSTSQTPDPSDTDIEMRINYSLKDRREAAAEKYARG